MRKRTLASAIVAIIVATYPAVGQTIFDSLQSGTDGVAFIGDIVIEDLHCEGGGLLQNITIAMTATGGGDTANTDVSVLLAVDGGDGIPDVFGDGDDALLFQVDVAGVEVEVDGITELDIDVADHWSIVPDDALLFVGATFSNPAVGHLFYGAPTVGWTDDIVWSLLNFGPVPAPGVADPKLANSLCLAFTLDVVQLPRGGGKGKVVGDLQDFESLDEGFQDAQLTLDGVTFSDGRDGFAPPSDRIFAIDDGTGTWEANPDMLEFIGGKLLNLNGFSNGPDGYLFTAMKSLKMSLDRPYTGVQLSVAYVVELVGDGVDFSFNDTTLLALRDGKMVASDTIHPDTVLGESAGGSFTFGAGALRITDVEFDSLVLFNNGPTTFGFVLMGMDNLILESGPVCPADLDGDGIVGAGDLITLLGAWGENPGHPADFDGDGNVGTADLIVLLGDWGPCE